MIPVSRESVPKIQAESEDGNIGTYIQVANKFAVELDEWERMEFPNPEDGKGQEVNAASELYFIRKSERFGYTGGRIDRVNFNMVENLKREDVEVVVIPLNGSSPMKRFGSQYGPL